MMFQVHHYDYGTLRMSVVSFRAFVRRTFTRATTTYTSLTTLFLIVKEQHNYPLSIDHR